MACRMTQGWVKGGVFLLGDLCCKEEEEEGGGGGGGGGGGEGVMAARGGGAVSNARRRRRRRGGSENPRGRRSTGRARPCHLKCPCAEEGCCCGGN